MSRSHCGQSLLMLSSIDRVVGSGTAVPLISESYRPNPFHTLATRKPTKLVLPCWNPVAFITVPFGENSWNNSCTSHLKRRNYFLSETLWDFAFCYDRCDNVRLHRRLCLLYAQLDTHSVCINKKLELADSALINTSLMFAWLQTAAIPLFVLSPK